MNLNLIKPKPKRVPHRGYFFTSFGICIIAACLLKGSTEEEVIEKNPLLALTVSALTITGTILIIKKLIEITDKKNKEYFALHPYRSHKQKYLDSINILELIQSNLI